MQLTVLVGPTLVTKKLDAVLYSHPLQNFKEKVVNIGTTPLNTYVQTKTYASHF